jgi:hypothetical protein
MGGSLAAVGTGFAASLGHVLWVIEAWVGIIVTACAAILAVLVVHELRAEKREHAPTLPSRVMPPAEVGDDTLAMLARHRRHEDDTFHWDGLGEELRRMTEGDR